MFNDFEPFEKATRYGRSAFGAMKEHRVPASPMNYTVWYAHCTGNHPDLSKALDQQLKTQAEITAESCRALFDSFFGSERDLNGIRGAGGQLQTALGQMIDLVARAGCDSSDYANTLVEVQNGLNSDPDAANMEKAVQLMLTETQTMVDKNRRLEESLTESSKEIEELQSHLEAVRKDSLTDALTGVGNRKCFDFKMSEALVSSVEQGEPLSLSLCDVDFFKTFNDAYGHRVGDEVLKVVGRHLMGGVKGRDTAARYGGEEFALILPQTDLKGAAALAEKLRDMIATKQLKSRKTGQSFGFVTLSFGAAQYRPGEPAGELIQRADEALYLAKRNGRNRVETEDGLDQELSSAD